MERLEHCKSKAIGHKFERKTFADNVGWWFSAHGGSRPLHISCKWWCRTERCQQSWPDIIRNTFSTILSLLPQIPLASAWRRIQRKLTCIAKKLAMDSWKRKKAPTFDESINSFEILKWRSLSRFNQIRARLISFGSSLIYRYYSPVIAAMNA